MKKKKHMSLAYISLLCSCLTLSIVCDAQSYLLLDRRWYKPAIEADTVTPELNEISQHNAVPITDTIEDINRRIFQQHPLQEPLTSKKIVDEIFNNNLIQLFLNS